MITFTIYIIDDEKSVRHGVFLGLKKNYHVRAFSTAEAAIEALKKEPPDLILLDIGLPGMNGIEALEKIKKINPEILILILTAYEDINTIISAMKLGAHDYIVKPIHMDTLKVNVKNALDTIKMKKEIQVLQERYLKENLPCLIGESDVIHNVMDFVDKIAKSPDMPVLILGESGTGKELIALAIHYKSPNFNKPFVALNCANIPKDLLESELFGHEKGAFSGAKISGKKGLVEEAAGGTLLLDEAGDLSLEAQAKLLRFIEEGEFYRIGGLKKIVIKTRIISSTNKDLNRMMAEGLFREDLFYRLSACKLEVPSLNKRREDIVPIAKYFLLVFSKKYSKNFSGISPETEGYLKNRPWKGNIRELRNLIEIGVLAGNGPVLTVSDFVMANWGKTSEQSEPYEGFPPLPAEGIDLAALEEHYIREALNKAQGSDTGAAKLLKMSYYAFRYQRKKLKNH